MSLLFLLSRPMAVWTFLCPASADTLVRIPNLPFFYLVYRAFSNWRAIAGGKHLQWLLENKLLTPTPSKVLDLVYAQSPATKKLDASAKEEILLTREQIRTCADALEVPELETELERAVWQLEEEFKKEEQKKQQATATTLPTQNKKSEARYSDADKKNR